MPCMLTIVWVQVYDVIAGSAGRNGMKPCIFTHRLLKLVFLQLNQAPTWTGFTLTAKRHKTIRDFLELLVFPNFFEVLIFYISRHRFV